LRELAAALKHQTLALPPVRYALAFGPSQDGRFLREFLYRGFNADQEGTARVRRHHCPYRRIGAGQ